MGLKYKETKQEKTIQRKQTKNKEQLQRDTFPIKDSSNKEKKKLKMLSFGFG